MFAHEREFVQWSDQSDPTFCFSQHHFKPFSTSLFHHHYSIVRSIFGPNYNKNLMTPFLNYNVTKGRPWFIYVYHCSINMIVAALVEAKRVTIAKEYDLMDKLEAIVPMSVWWFLPQYILCGLANICWAPRIVHWSNARVLEKLGSSNICYCYRSWKLNWINYYIYCAGYQLKLWWKMAW